MCFTVMCVSRLLSNPVTSLCGIIITLETILWFNFHRYLMHWLLACKIAMYFTIAG